MLWIATQVKVLSPPMEDEASDFSSDSEDDGRADAWSWVIDLDAACSYCTAAQSAKREDTHTHTCTQFVIMRINVV